MGTKLSRNSRRVDPICLQQDDNVTYVKPKGTTTIKVKPKDDVCHDEGKIFKDVFCDIGCGIAAGKDVTVDIAKLKKMLDNNPSLARLQIIHEDRRITIIDACIETDTHELIDVMLNYDGIFYNEGVDKLLKYATETVKDQKLKKRILDACIEWDKRHGKVLQNV